MQKRLCLITVSSFMLMSLANVNAAQILVSDVPAYNWYHGCGPTAAASILGYYDMNGYDNLFDASGWTDVSLTINVQDEISSPEHNLKYDSHPDDANLLDPPDTSIADFFHTSENLPYGWSYLSDATSAFVDYADYRGYDDWSAWNESFASFSFDDLKSEIDNNYLVMFLVDTDGDGGTDHFVPVFGYDDVAEQYACYTTWSESETIAWYDYQDMGEEWGVGYATLIRPGAADPVPEPATMLLFGTGLVGLAGSRLRKKKK